jgi:hypothetical protein
MDRQVPPTTAEIDPLVRAAVKNVRDRFGADGLRALMALARDELREAEEAERRLAEYAAPATDSFDAADTQAWLAYREADAGPDDGGR